MKGSLDYSLITMSLVYSFKGKQLIYNTAEGRTRLQALYRKVPELTLQIWLAGSGQYSFLVGCADAEKTPAGVGIGADC